MSGLDVLLCLMVFMVSCWAGLIGVVCCNGNLYVWAAKAVLLLWRGIKKTTGNNEL